MKAGADQQSHRVIFEASENKAAFLKRLSELCAVLLYHLGSSQTVPLSIENPDLILWLDSPVMWLEMNVLETSRPFPEETLLRRSFGASDDEGCFVD